MNGNIKKEFEVKYKRVVVLLCQVKEATAGQCPIDCALPRERTARGSYSLRVETRTIDKDQGRSSLHSSLPEIFKIVKVG